MSEEKYYQASELFKAVGRELKKIADSQSELNESGLMIKGATIKTSLAPESSLEKIKFSSNDDLFLSGRRKPLCLKIKIRTEVVVRD